MSKKYRILRRLKRKGDLYKKIYDFGDKLDQLFYGKINIFYKIGRKIWRWASEKRIKNLNRRFEIYYGELEYLIENKLI